MNHLRTILSLLFLCLCLQNYASAYLPAHPTNDTSLFENNNPGMLTLRWPPLGVYGEQVSYQLVGNATTGKNQGAIVHFTDNLKYLQNVSTPTPWIALINCDDGVDNSSSPMGYDAFSSANDQGAVAALLYSETSAACIVNEEYKSPEFDRVMDIFTTTRASAARLIESQFDNVSSNYTWFNATRLSSAYDAVLAFIANDGTNMKHSPPGYLMATLSASAGNDTTPSTPIATPVPTADPGNGGSGSGGTGLAMIILYSITGCVSALFCVVIISGAIRAIRHPERYGPRAGNMGMDGMDGPGQTRTAGLTRAILDTFPIIKFGRSDSENNTSPIGDKDVEHSAGHSPTSVEMAALAVTHPNHAEPRSSTSDPAHNVMEVQTEDPNHTDAEENNGAGSSSSQLADNSQQSTTDAPVASGDLVPEAIGRETCPICIVDFEIGDDLRVLPCPGKHRFHQHCVDPWLLELSSSCPICREDFAALETMVAAGDPEAEETTQLPTSSHPSRFSRYIRFAQVRRNRSRRENINAQASTTSLSTSTDPQPDNTTTQPPSH